MYSTIIPPEWSASNLGAGSIYYEALFSPQALADVLGGPVVPIPRFLAKVENQIALIRSGKLFVDDNGPYIGLSDVDWSSNNHTFFSTQLHGLVGIGAVLVQGEKLPADVETSVAEHIRDWAIKNTREKARNPRAWHEGTTMKRISNLLHLLNYVRHHGEIQGITLSEILYLIDDNASFLLDEPNIYKRGNHGVRQDIVLAATALSLPMHPRSGEMISLAEERLDAAATEQFTEGGIWLEHAPGYVNYMLRLMNDLSRLVSASPNFNPTRFIDNIAASRYYLMSVLFPDGMIPPVGRSSRMTVSPSVAHPKKVARHLREKEYSITSFLDYGHAVVRGRHPDGLYFMFVASQNLPAGKRHSDDLSILVCNHGRIWITEGGQHSTQPSGMTRYLRSPLAHSTYTLNGDYVRSEERPELRTVLTQADEVGEGYRICGFTERFVLPANFERSVLIDKAFSQISITDRLHVEDDTAVWQGRFQIAGDLKVRINGSKVVIKDVQTGDKMIITTSAPLSFTAVRGQRNPLSGWGRSPEHGPVTTLIWDLKGKSVVEFHITFPS